ncbi:hypothetical protein PTSG_11379 [Salpingoeca rosetta]|uniref:ERCC4 domain-containing protein n=1 Tax=Salpingoeca rosetta (strain ATCC 50818 / BSB-021) TaxID=946362 RepID=F2UT89_SALR5|nr:uncharacterized protein PTSG_11379 [Salpingoeca rosetta]EGD81348.1 hypothetical protein PTSG_11379 [Salpingoeca rosetta]|eukprot:XP_004987615.1 hypothetical protein PTSG_11379 [Salpingoeca rosetta]
MAEDEGSRQGGGVSGEEKDAVIDNMGEFGLDPKAGLLPFQQDMFKDIMADVDALLVTGQGMGLHRLLVSMLRVHCDPKSLVLVINANVTTVELATEELSLSTSFPPKILSMDQLSTDRRDIYLEGGVVFVTSRILVVDMLMGRVPMANVHGIVVPDAHRVIPTSSEAFILRLFRHENRTGFIKAITDSAQGLVGGFNLLEKVMRSLWVSQLYLWPRFEKRVIDTLSTRQPEVFEVKVDMTSTMQLIQLAISDLMVSCLKQLRKLRPSLEMEFLTVERGLFPAFDQALRRQLDPVWHTLGFRTKQLVKELKTLRTMAKYLDQYDPVSFYFYLEVGERGVFGGQSVVHRRLGRRAARVARRRERAAQEAKAKRQQRQRRGGGGDRDGDGGDDDDDEQEEFETTIPELVDLGTDIIEEADQQDDSQRGDGQQSDMAVPPDEEFRRHYRVLQPDDLMFILPFYLPEVGVSTARFARILNDVKPKTIVFYDPHLACAREVELYQSAHPEVDLHVYFMMYRTSFQEQQYLSSIRHEKEAFERIITAKRTMALPADQDGRRGIRQAEERQLKTRLVASRSSSVVGASTRRGGGRVAEGAPRPKVIVDMREFRSSLPSLIHEFGMDVVPVTLIVGDYVLSPDICVERKSLPDLIGSLSSGRLYSQVLAMTTYYARPALLIEFDESKPFSLLGSGETLSDDIEFKNTMSKLTLLTLTFPSLRVLWSRSPHATAELFYTLKQHQDEPDATAAANVGEEGTHNEEDYALEPMVVLKTVPGVTPHNAYAIMEKVKNLEELTQLGLKQLQEVAGKANGRLMYDFFNNTTTVDDDDKGHDDKKG